MQTLISFILVAIFQVVLPCPWWVFPEDSPIHCCEEKLLGGHRYMYQGYDESAKSEFNCSENCVYTREDEPGSRYCFKKGGKLYPMCTHNECYSASVMKHQLGFANKAIDYNVKALTTYVENGPGVTNYTEIMKELFSLRMQLLTPIQQKALQQSTTCSGERKECDQCFRTLFDPLWTCMVDKNVELCKKYLNLTSATCKSCFCELSKAKTCNNSILCPKDKHKDTKDNKDDTHPCDRTCTNSPHFKHFKCVFNLTMEELEATEGEGYKADGRKRPVFTYNKKMPGPTLVICEGDDLVVNLTNRINTSTTLHFHGIREISTPWADGVPWVTQYPILPGQSFQYGFNAVNYDDAPPGLYIQAGTYWYHSHVGKQRTNGAYGALIIRPMKTDDRFDEDEAKNTIIVQEWYESPANQTIRSLLINGHGRINSQSMSKYMEYKVDIYDKKYLFRVIGAISEDVPLRLSIDEHTFTAIAVDSQDIEPVTDLTYLWIAGGERFDIVVHTKTEAEAGTGTAHKIRVFGYADPNRENDGPYCTIAWLIYPKQKVPDYNVDIICDDDEFKSKPNKRTLNPIPTNFDQWENRLKYPEWKDNRTKPGDIFVNELRAAEIKPSLLFWGKTVFKTLPILEYTELDGLTFNNFSMKNPQIPFLLQEYLPEEDHCGIVSNIRTDPTRNYSVAMTEPYITLRPKLEVPERCNDPNKHCTCHHVHQLPYAPGYWTDIMLINNKKDAAAHPIHQHGGWFWVLGMGKYNRSISREFIMKEDQNCSSYRGVNKTLCLPRNFTLPVAKDTIQVPPGGYVILRTPLGNRGNWFFHCHINKHVLHGMAMVLQIGGTNVWPKYLGQNWCTGPLKIQCPTSEVSIIWNYGMKPEMCVEPGTEVTFHLKSGLNVNKVNKADYENCNANEETPATDVFVWTAPCTDEGTYFFISRRNDCLAGMKGKIHVETNCEQSLNLE